MKALKRLVWVLGVFLLGVPAVHAAEAKVTHDFRLSPIRVEPGYSGNFIKDAAVMGHRQLRGEFSGQVFRKFERIDIQNYDFIATYGIWPNAEIGVDVPVLNLDPRDDGIGQELGVGDISFWAKYKLYQGEGLLAADDQLALTAGFELQAETADDSQTVPCDGVGGKCGLGLGENGYNPFGSFRYQMGSLGFAGHVGYQIFESPLGEVFNYDFSTMVALAYDIVLRVELTGYNQFDGDDRDIFSVSPGLDWILDFVTVRIAGFKGVTNDSADWGLGGGIALTFGGDDES